MMKIFVKRCTEECGIFTLQLTLSILVCLQPRSSAANDTDIVVPIRNVPEPRKTRRVMILSANKRRFNSLLSPQRGRQLIAFRLASYAFSISLLIKLKNVNKWWQILRWLSKNHNLSWSKMVINYLSLSGKIVTRGNQSKGLLQLSCEPMGLHWILLESDSKKRKVS